MGTTGAVRIPTEGADDRGRDVENVLLARRPLVPRKARSLLRSRRRHPAKLGTCLDEVPTVIRERLA
jgi:hypothetical protein